jgi:uncharacterized protein YndB with AHSA1/START domain
MTGSQYVTRQKSFKTRVRERMEKTGESYTTARQYLIDKATSRNGTAPDDAQIIAISGQRISDEALAKRTDRAWDEWFDLLDEQDADKWPHADIARWLSETHTVDGWWAQTVTVGYEQARGLRVPGQKSDGSFSASGSKTVNVPVERLFEGFADESLRAQWLPDAAISVRTMTAPKSFRADWGDDGTIIAVFFTPKGENKAQVSVQHEKLPDADTAAQMKAYWRERLNDLKKVIEE